MANPKGNKETLTPYQPKWRSGKTRTIRVPIAIADRVLEAAREIDNGETLVTENEARNNLKEIKNNLNTVTGDKRRLIIEAFKELVSVPSNRGGQVKMAAVKIANLLDLSLEKTGRSWKITDTSE